MIAAYLPGAEPHVFPTGAAKLIPAGSGLAQYRNVRVEPTEEAKAEAYEAMGIGVDIDYTRTFEPGAGTAVRLEEYDAGYRG